MKDNTLREIIRHFDEAVNGIDFTNMPVRDSEDYRTLVLKTADEKIFSDGRLNEVTEWVLEIFDIEKVKRTVNDLSLINDLTDKERTRYKFYTDLKEVCYPLYHGQKVNWTSWPWNLKSDSDNLAENDELFSFIANAANSIYANLCAAICYDLKEQVWRDETGKYTSVARQEMADLFGYSVKAKWGKNIIRKADEEDVSADILLKSEEQRFCDNLASLENHIIIGRRLGMDFLAQSVYDAMEIGVGGEYQYELVDFAIEFGTWLKEHWVINDINPEPDRVVELENTFWRMQDEHGVTSCDLEYTWNILTLDVLGMSLESKVEGEKANTEIFRDWLMDEDEEWSDDE